MSETYSWVDGASNVAEAVAWQDRIARWPAVAAYKARTHALLGTRRPVLDVGAGTGVDLVAIGPGGVGVDLSLAMCRAARRRSPRVARAYAQRLPFPTACFAGARADRVLQHLAEPIAALREMVRVTSPQGRVVLAEPDQGSLVIEVPGARREIVERVRELRASIGYRNGRFARRLPAVCAQLGLDDISVDTYPLLLTDPDDAFGLPTWVAHWRDEGPFDEGDRRAWDRAIEQARTQGGFLLSLTYFVVSGLVVSGLDVGASTSASGRP